ncbi:CD59 glycoprotein-like [Engraulis encrasicolus]|uniref:CD59 glycoprotein-like n=1 Tax=Engraulis encrasicolus TaxID=184585 RepID=UPI002FD43963
MSSLVMLLLAMLATTDALQCHSCLGCPTDKNMTNCSAPFDSCLKAEVLREGIVIVGKVCGMKTHCDVEPAVPDAKLYCCSEDMCNGAGPVGKNMLLLLVPLASIFVLS